jgi:FkbM family methyltransferase
MPSFFQHMLNRILPQFLKEFVKRIKAFLPYAYSARSYSQEGEDMILRRIFENQKIGFYVDVGAHHPKRFSNTYYFYHQGWRGINIDALPGSMRLFQEIRPRDINLEMAVSDKKAALTFYIFSDPALSGFSSTLARKRTGEGSYQIIGQYKLTPEPLKNILDAHLPKDQSITFLSVDVEGYDLNVLKSNDWKKYRPSAVLVESLEMTLDEILESEIYLFMKSEGYSLLGKSLSTVIFRVGDGSQLPSEGPGVN